MVTVNSTFNHSANADLATLQGEMSVDESLLDKESPPPYVTFRKGVVSSNNNDLIEDLREQFGAFQSSMMSMLDSWFLKQDQKFSSLLAEFEGIRASIQFISDKYDDLEKKSKDVASRVTALENKLCSQQADDQRVALLESKLETMEQKSRSCNIEISNVPEKRGENLVTIVENIANVIKHPISSRDIIAIHRVPQLIPRATRPKNIVVKLSSQIVRDNFLAAARIKKGITSDEIKIPGSPQKIYINEHLTLQNKKLFRLAREAARQNKHRFVWIKHGIILVRADVTEAAFTIRSENDLSKIKPYIPSQ